MDKSNLNERLEKITLGHAATEGLAALYETSEVNSIDKLIDLADSVEERTIIITDITSACAIGINAYIRFWNKYDNELNIPIENRKPIRILIDSTGGELDAGLCIHDSITLSTTPVHTINISKAYSAGFMIFLAGHKRITYPNASFLYHEGSCGINQTDANKFDNYADFYKMQRGLLKKIMISRTTIDDAAYYEHARDDWWFSAEEAINYGIADEIIDRAQF